MKCNCGNKILKVEEEKSLDLTKSALGEPCYIIKCPHCGKFFGTLSEFDMGWINTHDYSDYLFYERYLYTNKKESEVKLNIAKILRVDSSMVEVKIEPLELFDGESIVKLKKVDKKTLSEWCFGKGIILEVKVNQKDVLPELINSKRIVTLYRGDEYEFLYDYKENVYIENEYDLLLKDDKKFKDNTLVRVRNEHKSSELNKLSKNEWRAQLILESLGIAKICQK